MGGGGGVQRRWLLIIVGNQCEHVHRIQLLWEISLSTLMHHLEARQREQHVHVLHASAQAAVRLVHHKGPAFRAVVFEHDDSSGAQSGGAAFEESDEVQVVKMPDDPVRSTQLLSQRERDNSTTKQLTIESK